MAINKSNTPSTAIPAVDPTVDPTAIAGAHHTPQNPAQPTPGFNAQGQPNYGGYPQQPYMDPNDQFSGFGQNKENNAAKRLADLSTYFASPIARGGMGERASKIVEAWTEILKAEGKNQFRFTVFTPEQDNTALTMISVSTDTQATAAMGGANVAAVHTLILEGDRIESRKFNSMQYQQIEVVSVPGDTYNDTCWKLITTKLGQYYPGYNLLDASAAVIPTEVALEDGATLRRILAAATIAVTTVLDRMATGRYPILTPAILKSDESLALTATFDFNPPEAITASGLPIRADISVTAALAGRSQNPRDFVTNQATLVTTDTYIDLCFFPTVQAGMNPGAYGPMAFKTYAPRCVITNIDAPKLGATTELTLLGILNATFLSHQNSWVAAFRQRGVGSQQANLRDLTAVGYEIPGLVAGGKDRVDLTKPEEAGVVGAAVAASNGLSVLISSVLHTDLIYSVDVPEVGDNAWLQSLLIRSANGELAATESIIQAANNLTANNFSKYYQGGPLISDDRSRIHLGYIHLDGKMVDIRTLDYLAFLNLFGERQTNIVEQYEDTYRPDPSTELQRLEARLKLLTMAAGEGQVHLKGYARRLTFTPNFIGALVHAFVAADLTISLNSGNYDQTTQRRYVLDGYQQYAYNPQAYQANRMFSVNMMGGAPNFAWGVPGSNYY